MKFVLLLLGIGLVLAKGDDSSEEVGREPCDGRGRLISVNGCTEFCHSPDSDQPYFNTVAVGKPCKTRSYQWRPIEANCMRGKSGFLAEFGYCGRRSLDSWLEKPVGGPPESDSSESEESDGE